MPPSFFRRLQQLPLRRAHLTTCLQTLRTRLNMNSQSDSDTPTSSNSSSETLIDSQNDPDAEVFTARFRPLIDFIKDNTDYLPTGVPYADHECSICLESASESRERVIQVDLPTCKHIFGATCFGTHITMSNSCPLCRTLWFEESAIQEDVEINIQFVGAETARGLIEQLLDQREAQTSGESDSSQGSAGRIRHSAHGVGDEEEDEPPRRRRRLQRSPRERRPRE